MSQIKSISPLYGSSPPIVQNKEVQNIYSLLEDNTQNNNTEKAHNSITDLLFKGFLKKIILAILSMSLILKVLPKNISSSIFTKLIIASLGYTIVGSLFVKFEEWLEEYINKLFNNLGEGQNIKTFADLASKTVSLGVLTSIGILKKIYFIHESFSDPTYNKVLNVFANITKPFEELASKLNLNIENFDKQDHKNILNTFHNLGEWFKNYGQKAKAKNIFLLPTISNSFAWFTQKGIGWENWRKAKINNIKPQFAKDILYKFAFMLPLGVGLEYLFSQFHKQTKETELVEKV